jgi:hypothetical protein
MAIPLMDNCCGPCLPTDCFDAKSITAQKAWPGFFPYATYRTGSWGASSDAPYMYEQYPGVWSVHYPDTPCSQVDRPTAQAALSPDPYEATKYLTATLVQTLWGWYYESYKDGAKKTFVQVDCTIVQTIDRRDGTTVYRSITLSPSPVPTGEEGRSAFIPYAGYGSATMTLNDDGSITRTGDTAWNNSHEIPDVTTPVFGDSGDTLVSWSAVVARTSASWTSTTFTALYPGDNLSTTCTQTATLTLTTEYPATTAIADALALLTTVSFDDVTSAVWLSYVRTAGAIALVQTKADYFPSDSLYSAAACFDGGLAAARKSWFRDNCGALCDVSAIGQSLMHPSTVETPNNGEGAINHDPETDTNAVSSGGSYEFTYSWVSTVSGYTYGVAWPVACGS